MYRKAADVALDREGSGMTILALILALLLLHSVHANVRLKRKLARAEACHDVVQDNWFRVCCEKAHLESELARPSVVTPAHLPKNEEIERGVW